MQTAVLLHLHKTSSLTFEGDMDGSISPRFGGLDEVGVALRGCAGFSAPPLAT